MRSTLFTAILNVVLETYLHKICKYYFENKKINMVYFFDLEMENQPYNRSTLESKYNLDLILFNNLAFV